MQRPECKKWIERRTKNEEQKNSPLCRGQNSGRNILPSVVRLKITSNESDFLPNYFLLWAIFIRWLATPRTVWFHFLAFELGFSFSSSSVCVYLGQSLFTTTTPTTMAEEEDTRDVADFYADIPVDFKGLRCCLRCSLLKSYDQVRYCNCTSVSACP